MKENDIKHIYVSIEILAKKKSLFTFENKWINFYF